MDDKTLTALKESIEKWERNAVAETPEDFTTGVASCALCRIFEWRGCAGCPVKRRTGKTACADTPFVYAAIARWRWSRDPSDAARRGAAHAYARDEVAFLRSLLPDRELDGTAHHPDCECNRCFSNMGDEG